MIESLVVSILTAAVAAAPDVVEILTGVDRKTFAERLERARKAFASPADPTEKDEARRARLIAAVRGEG